ncbi:MAG TPA: hypothetical protein GXZ87_05460, partial [Bacteroidales bacterium]|nr:hypothetical protein [Bacteroidales bacterium]
MPKDNLELAIANAQGYLANTTEGDQPGQYSATTRQTLSDAIVTAQGQLGGTDAEKNAAGNTLNQAIKTYITTFIAPKVSTLGSDEYYYALKTTDRGNRLVTNNGLANFITGNQYNDPSTVENTPEKQRWMFVKLSDNTYALVNKSTGHYFNPVPSTDNAEGTNKGFRPETTPITSAGWTLLYLKDVNKHHLVKGTNIQIHQSNSGNYSIINYYSLSDIGSNYAFVALDHATEKAATPTISVPAGNIQDGIEIEFTSTTPGAKFYYTTNGTTPNALSPIAANNKITINSTTAPNTTFTLKVVAFANGFMNSEVAEAAYTITNVEATWRGEATTGEWVKDYHWWYARWTGSEAQSRPDLASAGGSSGTPRNVLINNNNQTTMTVNTGGAWLYINSLTFGNEATDPRTINDNGFVFNGVSTIVNKSTATHTINSGISVDGATSGPLTINAAAGNLVLNGAYWTNGNPTIVTGAKDVTIGGNLQQPGSITKQGTGTLIISGNNGSHTGSYTVEGGVLELTGAGAFNTATTFTVKNGATLRINRNLELNNTTTIEAGATLEVAAGKQLTIGTGVVNNGTIIVKSGATITGNATGTGNAIVEQLVNKPQTYYIGSPVSNMTSSANIGNAITFTESNDEWSSAAAFANP